MARSVVGRAVVVREKYYWPDIQLNVWTIVMLATAGTILGVNASFWQIQNQMNLGVPWIFPYGITVGALTVIFILIELVLIAQRRLLPGIMMLLSFVLLVLFITGIIGTGIQLFGSNSNVNNLCSTYVDNMNVMGVSSNTLAWLEQNSICSSWKAVFSFWIVGTVFLVWMIVMAMQVSRNQFDNY
ncbi:hypothetical protein EJ05DRAFT_538500 [Pseudovirgaria hyperparasitica]|uniref:MARVEL domain-containing protein n=1 Tax=Pseudovirgaria hyperparasitica TaxID=470096 RepID=A0A6A6W7V5_9PEZI|nr:uncharacterized protein EJ05DRAFT_538500 [Pseudovirgaria hyperparasitica]KAF2758289.1 hypothetical protein EJ05DRAFT_538500 [Pseudovirgaria hyperparasitica]